MLSYILRRILLMFPTLLGITFVVFMVMALSPGGIGGNLLDEAGQLDSEQGRAIKAYYEQKYRTDLPLVGQYLWWLNRVSPVGFDIVVPDEGKARLGSFQFFKAPDLGESRARGRDVLDLYGEALPITLMLNLITTPIIYILAITTGIYAARHRGGWFDLSSGFTMLGLWSLPNIMVAVLLIGFFANRDYFYWFPPSGLTDVTAEQMPFFPRFGDNGTRGWLVDALWHLVLPVICLTYGGFAFLMKLMRSSMLENISADFVRTARAKGVDGQTVLWTHVFRNSLLPLITIAAFILPGLLAGSIVVEKIFSIPGMGKLYIEAVTARDLELVMAGTLIGGVLTLICILVADLLYAVADPRVSYE